jgi:hypothetical protein
LFPFIIDRFIVLSSDTNENVFLVLYFYRNGAPQLPGVDPMITNWAISQVAAALVPALSQLTSSNLQHLQIPQAQQQLQQLQAAQQQQQQQAQQLVAQQKAQLQARIQEQQAIVNQKLFQLLNKDKVEAQAPIQSNPIVPAVAVSSSSQVQSNEMPKEVQQHDPSKYFAAQFKQAYDRHLCSLGIQPEMNENEAKSNATSVDEKPTTTPKMEILPSTQPESVQVNEFPRTEEDKEGGTALLGFLSSLRNSYENVLRDKQLSIGSGESMYSSNRPATVTDSNSSQQRDSSVEDSDWNSEKKTDNSSSEDSEKEEQANTKQKRNHHNNQGGTNVYHNQGPPRKRLKVKRVADKVRAGPSI